MTNCFMRNGIESMTKKDATKVTRRQIITTVTVGAAATTFALPAKWKKPLVDVVVTPAHAAASEAATTLGTTTTPAPTTS